MIVLSIIVFILTLSVIIVLHELGHFIVAKKAGILCYEFSLGMGPKIWSKKVGETTYSLRLIPIGGFVSMAGEEGTGISLEDDTEIGFDLEDDLISKVYTKGSGLYNGKLISHEIYKEMYLEIEIDGEVKKYNLKKDCIFTDGKDDIQAAPYERCFESKSLLHRFLSIFAGPFMNFVLGLLILIIYSFIVGVPNYDSTVIGESYYNSEKALVVSKNGEPLNEEVSLAGFEILDINGVEIKNWNNITDAKKNLYEEENYKMTMTAKKNNDTYVLEVYPYVFLGSLGIYVDLADKSDLGVKAYLYCNNAEQAGFIGNVEEKTYSIIKKCNDVEINNIKDLINFSNEFAGSNVTLQLIDNEAKEYSINYKMYDRKTVEKLGIDVYEIAYGVSPTTKVKFFSCLGNSFKYFAADATSVFDTFNLLFTSKDVGVKNLSGPVGIYQMVSSSLSAGLTSYLSLFALLSINIGLVNLLPIPALDGGRIVFLGYELITRRKPNKKFENTLNTVMFILIMILFVYITFNDILRF